MGDLSIKDAGLRRERDGAVTTAKRAYLVGSCDWLLGGEGRMPRGDSRNEATGEAKGSTAWRLAADWTPGGR